MVSKVDRAKYGPGLVEITLGALLSVILGALIAFVFLVLRPVTIVHALPKEKPANAVYYIEGSKDSAHGRQWLRKKQIFVEGGSVSVGEAELNTFVAGNAPKQGNAPKPAAKPTGKDAKTD